jgi:hypothetical protein
MHSSIEVRRTHLQLQSDGQDRENCRLTYPVGFSTTSPGFPRRSIPGSGHKVLKSSPRARHFKPLPIMGLRLLPLPVALRIWEQNGAKRWRFYTLAASALPALVACAN